LFTVIELAASTQVGAGGNGQRLRLPIETKPTNPFGLADLNFSVVLPNNGLMMKKFGETVFACFLQKIEPAGTQLVVDTNSGSVTSSALLRFRL